MNLFNAQKTRPQFNFGLVSTGRENNFDFLRFFLATIVILAHCYAFLNRGTLSGYDPLVRWSHGQVGLGGLAVDCFFIMSGFLITKSWLGSKSLGDYAIKRSLRILPGLCAALLFAIFIIGPLGTRLSLKDYFFDPSTYRYFGFMLHRSMHYADQLPGLFETNPWPGRVNGSLWTIRHELICYCIVASLGLAQLYKKPIVIMPIAAVFYIFSTPGAGAGESDGIRDFFHLLALFMAGMLFFLYRDRIPYSRRLLLTVLGIIAVTGFCGILPYFLPILLPYVILYVAFNKTIRLYQFAKHGDISYGMYVYAFPIQQLLVARLGTAAFNPYTLFLVSMILCVPIAMLSWRLIEKPFMRMKPRSPFSKLDASDHALVQSAGNPSGSTIGAMKSPTGKS